MELVFEKLDQEIATFQSWSGLHCGWGCGKCCFKPDIEATILEFLPFAFYLHQQDKAFEWLEKSYQKHEESLCSIGIDTKFDFISGDQRFKKIIKKFLLK